MMADVHGSPLTPGLQMPQASTAGSAPVPYAGPDLSPEPPDYGIPPGPYGPDGAIAEVITSPAAGYEYESPQARDLSAGVADAPYYPGPLAPIDAAGDPDAGGRDNVAGDVISAVTNAEARIAELQSDLGSTGTPGAGSMPVHAGTIGDLMHFPPSPLDPGAGVGNTLPTAAFYDPTREYGGTQGAPGYQGEAQ